MIFTNATIITMGAQREILRDAAVAVVGDRIVGIGPTDIVTQAFPSLPKFDYTHHIIAPGLIDTHVHTCQVFYRGISGSNFSNPPRNWEEWLFGLIFPMEGAHGPGDGSASMSLAVLEMLKSGTTSFLECMTSGAHDFDGQAQVCIDSGIRAALGRMVMDIPAGFAKRMNIHPAVWEKRDASIASALAKHEQWDNAGNGRLQVWFGCRTADSSANPSLYGEVAEVARERGMRITIHHSEVEADNSHARSLGYRSHMDFAYRVGLLGPNSVLAHCTAADDEDIELLAKTGTHVSHNPANNAVKGWGPTRVGDMLAAGVNVALGCDSVTDNATFDMLSDMRTALHVQRYFGRKHAFKPATILEMATINGARALGIVDQVGSLEVGKKADIITVNTNIAHLTPVNDPVSTLVMAAVGSDVDTVVIDGRMVMKSRQILTMDETAILSQARTRSRDMIDRVRAWRRANGWGGTEPVGGEEANFGGFRL